MERVALAQMAPQKMLMVSVLLYVDQAITMRALINTAIFACLIVLACILEMQMDGVSVLITQKMSEGFAWICVGRLELGVRQESVPLMGDLQV